MYFQTIITENLSLIIVNIEHRYLIERRRKQEEAEKNKLRSIMHIGGMIAGAHDNDVDGM